MLHHRLTRSRRTAGLGRSTAFASLALALSSAMIQIEASADESHEPATSKPLHEASVSENTLILESLPGLHLAISSELGHLGNTSFRLDDRTQVDVFLFAETRGDSLRRFVKVQLETLIDDTADDFHWTGVDTVQIAGAEYYRGYWCFDAAEVSSERPDSDTAETQRWLARGGHSQEGVFVGTRLARVFNDGRSELLVFYGESTRITGVDCEDEDAAMKHLPAIVDRAERAYALAQVDEEE